MREIVRMGLRLLAAHWPALLAWYLAGSLGRYLSIQLAGYVGGYTALGGILLLPLAILAKLVSVVAMFLVLRDGMLRLSAIAPNPVDRGERLRSFRDALLSAVLPFIAVYAILGFLIDDVAAYLQVALAVQTDRQWAAILEETTLDTSGAVDSLTWEPWTIIVVALAFGGRWAWKRWQQALPRWTALGATYLEALWIFLAAYFLGEAFGQVTAWIDTRQAMVWLADLRRAVGELFAPLGWTWDAVEWLLGQAGAVLFVPLAWLTIAGVIYGRTVSPQGVQLRGALVDRARSRYGSLPQRLRRRLVDLGSEVGGRFRPIWQAILLMWRGGPILVGGYVLIYTVILFVGEGLRVLLTRLVGPHDLFGFWVIAATPVFLIVPLVVEPLRTVLIAATYDATVGALIGAPVVSSGDDLESEEARQLVRDGELDAERTASVVGDEKGHPEGERSP
ncbi:hypothetical protein [Microbacterium invictum]|uniref:Integral membrane protein n=1 Tax=Microbacterium invictum TaxID=515415 RepID=A0ABZ0V728_9MICO|nr:hypothetical protein [Microbacterium invictum]WQB68914.1 hypothetical protein T9R20_09300 [Microbacterium invictum]